MYRPRGVLLCELTHTTATSFMKTAPLPALLALATAYGGKADMTFCGANVRF